MPTAPSTGATGAAILITDPQGSGLENYTITLINGVFIVAPGNLTITANDQTKTYGDSFHLQRDRVHGSQVWPKVTVWTA